MCRLSLRTCVPYLLTITAVCIPTLTAQPPLASGTLDVHVADDKNADISGIVVVLTLVMPDTTASRRAFADATDAGGAIHFASLPFGLYDICAQPRYAPFVDSCRWARADRVHLTSLHASETVRIKLTKGVTVDVRLDDPDQLLTTSSGSGRTPAFVDVLTPIGYQPMPLAAEDAGGKNYRAIVPPNVTAKLRISAANLNIADDHGRGPDASGNNADISVAPADNSKFLRFTVRAGH